MKASERLTELVRHCQDRQIPLGRFVAWATAEYVRQACERSRNFTQAAELLQVHRNTLTRMRKRRNKKQQWPGPAEAVD